MPTDQRSHTTSADHFYMLRVEMMTNLAMLMFLLASIAVAITNGRVLQLSNSDKQLFVKEHNLLRAGVSPAAVNMKPMVWSNTLAAYAAGHLSRCIYAHTSGGRYGENLYITTASAVSYPGAVRSWYSENKDYNYYCNSCKDSKVCGHYTQVVWEKSTQVGCAVAYCPTVSNGWRNAYIVMCNYNPPGNVRGQRPYSLKKGCKKICKKCPNTVDSDCNCKSNVKDKNIGIITKAVRGHILKLHRELRKSVRPQAVDMGLLKWNKNMAKQAQTHVERCAFVTSSFNYGENSHFSYGTTPDFNATVMKWYGQGKDYNYYCNQCKAGRRCNQYTQLMQSSAQNIGCGSHICPTVSGLRGWRNVWIFVCFYDQRVVRGKRPYKSNDSCSQICRNCSTAKECKEC